MNHRGFASACSRAVCLRAATALCLWTLAVGHSAPAEAEIFAQYTFNDGTADDSSGNDYHGVVVDPGSVATYTGGAVDLRANNGFSSNQDFSDPNAMGAYVDLPNGVFTDAVFEGTQLDASFEIWATEEVHRSWSRLFDFGTSDGGEDMATGGGSSEYIFVTTAQGDNGFFVAETHNSTGGVQFPTAAFPGSPNETVPALPVGEKHHVALTLNQAGASGGIGDNGTATLYLNGVSVGSAPIQDGLFIDFMDDENNWLGRSQYPDQLFDGTIDEFRLYDTALTPEEVLASFNAGPVAVPFPVAEVNRDTGEVVLANKTDSAISLTGYSLVSPDGALDVANWDSIAPDDGWSRDSETANEAGETGGTAIEIAAGGTLSLGTLWKQTPIQDVAFSFATSGASGAGELLYAGSAVQRSDLNGDGAIDTADWTIFRDNNETTLPMGAADAYLHGDLNGDLANDRVDFALFKGDYIAANGAAAFAALQGVPEPTSLALFAVGAATLLLHRRRSSRRPVVAPRNRRITTSGARLVGLLLVAFALALATTPAAAGLAHRYSFDSDVSDSVGGQNGTVVDAGVDVNHAFVDGQLDLSGNPNEGSNAIVEGAYVDLPNGLVTGAVTGGSDGAVSFEWWATVSEQRTWQRFGDFGSSNDGEDASPGGSAADYVLVTPNSGRYANGLEMTNHPATNSEEPNVGLNGPFAIGEQAHVVAVYNHADTSAGPNGTMSLYLDGSLVGTNFISADIDLGTMDDNNNWLGRSQWPDALFAGSFNEFRVYDSALTANEVVFNGLVGPDNALPPGDLMTIEVNMGNGQVVLKNELDVALDLDYYEIRSEGGALNPSGWNSLSDQDGLPGSGEGWDVSGGVEDGKLIELYLGDVDGALADTFAGKSERALGAAFDPSVFGTNVEADLTFGFGLLGSSATIEGKVIYVPGEAGPDGDFNGDGQVDGADFLAWQRGNSPIPGSASDLADWEANYGTQASTGSAGAVPEPTGLGLLLLTAAGFGAWRKRQG